MSNEVNDLYNSLNTAAKYANLETIQDKLNKINAQMGCNEYLVAFMGQFSAGKSRFINQVLARDILPVHSVETTPIVTFIKYGSSEKAIITYKDSVQKQISMEDVKNIWQNDDAADRYDLMSIANVTVYLDMDLFRNGLIIADTPGINTLVEHHEEITFSLLDCVEELFYVTAKSMTASDIAFLNQVAREGIKTSVVRTHMDLINEEEENILETIESEKSIYQQFLYGRGKLFFVSNVVTSEWYSGVDKVKHYMSSEISAHIRANIEASCLGRLQKFVQPLYDDVADRVKILQEQQQGSCDLLLEKKRKSENILANVDKVLAHKLESINRDVQNIAEYSQADLDAKRDELIRDFNLVVERQPATADIYDALRHQAIDWLEQSERELSDAYAKSFNDALEKFNQECIDIGLMDKDFISDEIPVMHCLSDMVRYQKECDTKLQAKYNELLVKSRQLEQLKADNSLDVESYEESLSAVEQELEEIRAALESARDYEIEYIEHEGDDSYSKLFSNIGNIADIALIFVPGGQIKGAAKAAGMAAKSAKAVNMVAKAKKAGKIIGMLEKAKDAAVKGAQKYNKIKNKVERNSPGLADYLSLEYWGRKLGEELDTPPSREVDQVAMRAHAEEVRRLEQAQMSKINKSIEIKRTLGKLKDANQEKIERSRMLEESSVKLKSQIAKLEKECEQKMLSEYARQTKSDWSNWYTERLNDICRYIQKNYRALFMDGFSKYQDAIAKDYRNRKKAEEASLIALEKELATLSENDLAQEIKKGELLMKELIAKNV